MINFGPRVCRDVEAASNREWLETNGLGGFASSTIIGLNTRRYHGLLVAATDPPVGRVVLLSKLEETLVLADRRFELSANKYPGVVHPVGYQYMKSFKLEPFPTFVYEVEGIEIEKSIFMVDGENTTVVRYRARFLEPARWKGASLIEAPADGSDANVKLEIRPLIAFRDYHSLTHENGGLDATFLCEENLAHISPYAGMPGLYIAHNAFQIAGTGDWYRGFQYDREQERGLDFQEDLFNPMVLTFNLRASPDADLIISTGPQDISQAPRLRSAELARREAVERAAPVDIPVVRSMVKAAQQYIVDRGKGKSVIAGYPWFADWGRDTMISLPGLLLLTNRGPVAKSILSEFARYVDRGMLPNRFPDAGETPEYNTVDATLWFFESIRAFLIYTEDYQYVRESLYDILKDIIDWHIRGTRFGIAVDDDGLLSSGADGVQLTWMDAKVGEHVVTPRRGKPVEIQALWFNALKITEELATRFDDAASARNCSQLAERAKRSFNDKFWNADANCLYDVVDGERREASIRPNQIFAVSLKHSMLSLKRATLVVDTVERHLLTPFGLRSLSPADPNYIGRYQGDADKRDASYHQGTVWAWLIGPFITAYLRVNSGADPSESISPDESLPVRMPLNTSLEWEKARSRAAEWIDYFSEHLEEGCLGQISEIFDGDSPHEARGCPAQAWSVAELLRAACEHVYDG